MPIKLYTRLIHALIFGMWAPTAFGAVTLMKTLEGYTLGVLAVLLLLSTLAGGTALILDIDKGLRLNGKLPPFPSIYITSHVLASWLGGVLAVIVSEIGGISDWYLLLLVLCLSFGGVKVLESTIQNMLSKILPTVGIPK